MNPLLIKDFLHELFSSLFLKASNKATETISHLHTNIGHAPAHCQPHKLVLLTLQSSSRLHLLLRPGRILSVIVPGDGVTDMFADAAINQYRQAAA